MAETDPTGAPPPASDIRPVSITDEMRRSYLDYAMSVIVSRALPDARDGLKPVHRRILYSAFESGHLPERKYVKSARIVGDVIGLYHPHGDQSIYDALVRMAQDFSMRLMLIDGQGNFGSVDGDPPAAMRYTESRLAKPATYLLSDIDKNTVDFGPNYDESREEPTVLPARFPNLLVNGAGGIAVGMATNIPPHNLGELIDACVALIDDPGLTIEQLNEIVPGPDFPTGGMILGRAGTRQAYTTGRGSVIMRAKSHVEELRKEREALIFTEIPYQVNKATLVEKIAELVKEKRVEGISDLRDESDRSGMRIVVEIKRDAMAEVVLNQLYRFTPLQSSFGCNMVALNGGRPELMNLKDLLQAFVDFREEVVSRRTKYLLGKARERAHVLCGLAIAVANIDEVIRLIRTSPDPNSAREALMGRDWPPTTSPPSSPWWTTPATGSRRTAPTACPRPRPAPSSTCASSASRPSDATRWGTNSRRSPTRSPTISTSCARGSGSRRSSRTNSGGAHPVRDPAPHRDRRLRLQRGRRGPHPEGGHGRHRVPRGLREARAALDLPVAAPGRQGPLGHGDPRRGFRHPSVRGQHSHAGAVLLQPGPSLQGEGVAPADGRAERPGQGAGEHPAIADTSERITTIMPLPEDEASWETLDVMFATASGNVRRNKLSDFTTVNRNGKIAMKLDEGDHIVHVEICRPDQNVLLTTALGQCIRFPVEDVRVFKGRDSTGVRGINLASGDRVISMTILNAFDASAEERAGYLKMRRAVTGEVEESTEEPEEGAEAAAISLDRYNEMGAAEQYVLTISERGFGKRSSSFEYRTSGRGGKGITAMRVNARNGHLVASFPVEASDQIMLVTNGGQLIRVPVDDIRIVGRASQGVTVFNTDKTEKVVSVEHIEGEDEGDVGGEIEAV